MRTAATSLALLLALALSLFSSAPIHAQPPAPALTPVDEAVTPQSLPSAAEQPAPAGQPAAEDQVQLPPAALAAIEPQAAGDERWDDRFQLPGISSTITAATAAPDGTLYVVADGEVFRWDGRTWRSLGDSSFEIRGMAIFQGQLYVAGDFNSIGASNVRDIARWDGARWRQVGSGVGPQRIDMFDNVQDTGLYSLAVLGDTLYVGGDFNRIDGLAANNIAGWNGTAFRALGQGVRAADFQGNISNDASAIVRVIEPANGKLYVGGQFGYAGTTRSGSLGVWDGSAWSGVGGGVLDDTWSDPETATVNAIAVDGANVYVGGQLTLAGPSNNRVRVVNIARWNGSAWSDLDGGAGGNSLRKIYALRVDNGTLYAGGEFDAIGGVEAPALATWNGTAWQPTGAMRTFDTVQTIIRAPGGGLYIGGEFSTIGGVLATNIVRLSGTSWKALGEGLSLSDTSNCCAGQVRALVADNAGRIYAGGRFKAAGGVITNNIARWNGTRWEALGEGVSGGDVEALALAGDTLYVGGSFTGAGGQAIGFLASYNTATGRWSALGGGVNNTVYALDYANDTLYVGGDFSRAGSLDAYNLAFWDGTRWSVPDDSTRIYQVFDSCSEAGTQVYALKASGRYLVIGGNFRLILVNPAAPCSTSSYRLANSMALYDLETDRWFLMGTNGNNGVSGGAAIWPGVEALEVVGPDLEAGGTLYVGGDFGQAGSINAQNLARWTIDAGWAQAGGTSGDSGGALPDRGVFALDAAGGSLYVGGNFSTAGTATAASVARLDLATNTWSALGSGVAEKRTVHALVAAPDAVYIGGAFDTVGGKPSAGIAAWAATPARATIGVGGGNVNGEVVALTFPSGAVPADTVVTLTTLFAPPAKPAAGRAIARAVRVGATRNGQAVASFSQPYTLRISYSPALLAASGIANASSLKIARWDGQRWVELSGARIDTTNRIVSVSTNQAGDFALVGTATSPQPGERSFKVYVPLLRK